MACTIEYIQQAHEYVLIFKSKTNNQLRSKHLMFDSGPI